MTTPSRLRHTGLSVTLWAFGFATTLLLIGLWGRTTSNDESTIAESARAVVTSELIRDRVADWVEEGLSDAGVALAVPAGELVDRVLAIDEVQGAVDALVSESVAALVADDAEAAIIDIGEALVPAAPLIADELEIDEVSVRAALASVEPIDLRTTAANISQTATTVHGVLTLVVVLAAVAMAACGAASVALSDDRKAMMRGLAVRVALSAFSFALLFQIGGWLIDPAGGRSPVLTGSSILIRSNGHVFVLAALVASAVAAAMTVRRRRRRPVAGSDSTLELAPV